MSFYSFPDFPEELPIGTMYCIGRNYASHAKEMGAQVPQESPLVFIKPPNAYVPDGGIVKIPDFSSNMHHEVELVAVIGKDGYNINENDALEYVVGYGVGVDLTLRDVQAQAKQKGEPWSISKSFFGSAPISTIVPANSINPNEISLRLLVNGEQKQYGKTADMERSVSVLVSFISQVFGIRKGDCIFTGTPEGVGQISPNSTVRAELGTICSLEFTVS